MALENVGRVARWVFSVTPSERRWSLPLPWGRGRGGGTNSAFRAKREGLFPTGWPDDGFREERASTAEAKRHTIADLKWSQGATAAPAQHPDNPIPVMSVRASGLVPGKVCTATANDSSDVRLDLIGSVCVHVDTSVVFFERRNNGVEGLILGEGDV